MTGKLYHRRHYHIKYKIRSLRYKKNDEKLRYRCDFYNDRPLWNKAQKADIAFKRKEEI